MVAKFGDKISVGKVISLSKPLTSLVIRNLTNINLCTCYPAGIKDPGMSGNLEVRVVGGKLLHSKKGGAGFVDTDAKMDKIIEGVEEALAAE